MDTELLKTFIQLAQTKNFTKAAGLVNRTQSAVSLQIQKLEEMIGKSLFERHNRSVIMTPDGELFFTYAKQILGLQEELLQRFSNPYEEGEVFLGTPEDIATAYLPAILAAFAKSHPKILLNVICDLSIHLIQGFEKGIYDLILVKQDSATPHSESTVIWEESLVWAIGENVNLEDFYRPSHTPLPLVVSPSPCVYRQRGLERLNERGIRWRIAYTSPSLSGIIAAAKGGLGLSILPFNLIPEGLKRVQHPLLPDLHTMQIAILRKKQILPPARSLAQYIIDHIAAQNQKGNRKKTQTPPGISKHSPT